jgi:hypothetical protein
MLGLISRWFAPWIPTQDYQRSDYVLLCLILVVGVVLRFWGLGNVGFFGDERHMAMPAMAILETGEPVLPSGMYYSRALLSIYLMSGSVWLFGDSEWAFRLPSAVVGSLTGLAAFFMGRRFLSPQFNLAFVATITLLPAMVEVSQIARMYVFLVTCLIWYAACLFRWERDQRISSLLLALIAWSLALHFQRLAIFAAPLFLFPGLSRHSWSLLVQGAAAFLAGVLIFQAYAAWMSAKWPEDWERASPPVEDVPTAALEVLASGSQWLMVASVLVIVAMLAVLLFRVARKMDWPSTLPVLAVGLGLLSLALLHYHIGGILLGLGAVFWLREPRLPRSWLLAALALATVITVVHVAILHTTGLYPGRQLIGALIGMPSVWPILRFLEYSPVAGVIYMMALAFALARFARGQPLPVHFLFFAIGVWIPLLIIGYFAWHIPPRYAQGQLAYFLLCTFAGLAYLARERGWIAVDGRSSAPMVVVLVLAVVALVNPVALARVVNPGYDLRPDHKGAAEYIEAVDPARNAILIAEDVVHQTYYLGRVDYWLREIDDVYRFSIHRDDRLVDFYTATDVIGTGAELEEVLDASDHRDVYIIGSGENFRADGTRSMRGRGIAEILESDRLEVVYEGRDGKTKVWKLRRP